MRNNGNLIYTNYIELPSDLRHVKKGSSFVLEGLGALNLDESTLYDIKFSIEEALINAMKYGNKLNEKINAKVSFYVYKDRVEVAIEDKGSGFDYSGIPDPTQDSGAINRHSGRGVFLIKHLMDDVIFNEKGNVITMVKSIPGVAQDDSG